MYSPITTPETWRYSARTIAIGLLGGLLVLLGAIFQDYSINIIGEVPWLPEGPMGAVLLVIGAVAVTALAIILQKKS